MTELPDDELDKLFRKSSEEFDPQFDPEDWDSLKKRLDAEDGKVAGGWFRKWWSLALLALLIPAGFAGYYFTKNSIQKGEKTAAINKSGYNVASQAKEPAAPPVSSKVLSQSPEPEAPPVSRKVGVEEPLTNKSAALANNPLKQHIKSNKALRNKETDFAKSLSIPNSNITDYQSRKKLPRRQSKAGGVYLEPNRSKGKGGDGAFSIQEQTNASNPRVEIRAAMLAARPLHWNNQPENPAVTVAEPDSANVTAASEKKKEDYGKWAVRVGYSPDLSTVGFKNFTRPGAAFSLMIEYALSPKLYLQTGVVRSEKDYYAYAGEYKLPKYVTAINTPYGVDGSCTMFEIPLGVRYNVVQKAQSNFFIGTGFSSYYADKEQYKYRYADYVHGQKPQWSGKTGWFLLSHINASVGYERTITKKLSLVAEPYIRIPVKGVGYGKVNLMTIGTWISLRYTPSFK